MYPSLSSSETGLASSASNCAVVCGGADFGIKDRSSREEGSRVIGGREKVCGALGGILDF
jgi:hypothetical protein